MRAVKAYRQRGQRSVKDVAAEHGVSLAVLYFWVRRDDEGRLHDMPAAKPVRETGALARSSTAPMTPHHDSIVIETSVPRRPSLEADEREELVLLRVEVRKLKAALAAYAEIRGDE